MKYLLAFFAIIWLAACTQPDIEETTVVEAQATYGAFRMTNPWNGPNNSEAFSSAAFGNAGSTGWDTIHFSLDTLFYGDTADIEVAGVRSNLMSGATFMAFNYNDTSEMDYVTDYSFDSLTWINDDDGGVTGTLFVSISDVHPYKRVRITPSRAGDTLIVKGYKVPMVTDIAYTLVDTLTFTGTTGDTIVMKTPYATSYVSVLGTPDTTNISGYTTGSVQVDIDLSFDGEHWYNYSTTNGPAVATLTALYANPFMAPYIRLRHVPNIPGETVKYTVYLVGSKASLF